MCYTLQAMGKGTESLILSACRQGIFHIPLLFLLHACFGLYGIIWTQLAADACTLILSLFLYRRIVRQIKKEQLVP